MDCTTDSVPRSEGAAAKLARKLKDKRGLTALEARLDSLIEFAPGVSKKYMAGTHWADSALSKGLYDAATSQKGEPTDSQGKSLVVKVGNERKIKTVTRESTKEGPVIPDEVLKGRKPGTVNRETFPSEGLRDPSPRDWGDEPKMRSAIREHMRAEKEPLLTAQIEAAQTKHEKGELYKQSKAHTNESTRGSMKGQIQNVRHAIAQDARINHGITKEIRRRVTGKAITGENVDEPLRHARKNFDAEMVAANEKRSAAADEIYSKYHKRTTEALMRKDSQWHKRLENPTKPGHVQALKDIKSRSERKAHELMGDSIGTMPGSNYAAKKPSVAGYHANLIGAKPGELDKAKEMYHNLKNSDAKKHREIQQRIIRRGTYLNGVEGSAPKPPLVRTDIKSRKMLKGIGAGAALVGAGLLARKLSKKKEEPQKQLMSSRVRTIQFIANPIYREGVRAGIHHIGDAGTERTVKIKNLRSPQHGVNEQKVNKLARFTKNMPGTPTVSHLGGGIYTAKDGNHRIAAALKQGKRTVKVKVQRLSSQVRTIHFGKPKLTPLAEGLIAASDAGKAGATKSAIRAAKQAAERAARKAARPPYQAGAKKTSKVRLSLHGENMAAANAVKRGDRLMRDIERQQPGARLAYDPAIHAALNEDEYHNAIAAHGRLESVQTAKKLDPVKIEGRLGMGKNWKRAATNARKSARYSEAIAGDLRKQIAAATDPAMKRNVDEEFRRAHEEVASANKAATEAKAGAKGYARKLGTRLMGRHKAEMGKQSAVREAAVSEASRKGFRNTAIGVGAGFVAGAASASDNRPKPKEVKFNALGDLERTVAAKISYARFNTARKVKPIIRNIERKHPIIAHPVRGYLKGAALPIPGSGEVGAGIGLVTGAREQFRRRTDAESILRKIPTRQTVRMKSKQSVIRFGWKKPAAIAASTIAGGAAGGAYGQIGGVIWSLPEHKRLIERMKTDQVDTGEILKNYPHIKQISTPGQVPKSFGWKRKSIQHGVRQAQRGHNAFALPRNKKHGDFVIFPKTANRSIVEHEIGHIKDNAKSPIGALEHGFIGDLRGTTLKREKAAWDQADKPDKQLQNDALNTYRKRALGTRVGAGIGAATGLGASLLVASKFKKQGFHMQSKIRSIRFSLQDKLQKAKDRTQKKGVSAHDVETGALEGGVAAPFLDRLVHGAEKAPLWEEGKVLGGLPRKAAIGAGLGAVTTGLIGAGLNKFRPHEDQEMSSRARVTRFSQPIQPGTRTAVTRDRYVKHIHDQDLERGESNYLRSGILGAAAGGLMKGKAGAKIGAVAGIGATAAIRAATARNRDQFGDRTYAAKRSEKAPWQAAGVTAGVLAGKKLNQKLTAAKVGMSKLGRKVKVGAGLVGGALLAKKLFFNVPNERIKKANFIGRDRARGPIDRINSPLIQFAREEENPERRAYDSMVAAQESEDRDWRKGRSLAGKIGQGAQRTGRLIRDVTRKIRGQKNVDSRGRERKNEWEKPWVRHAATLGVGAASLAIFHKTMRGTAPGTGIQRVKELGKAGKIGDFVEHHIPAVKHIRSMWPNAKNRAAGETASAVDNIASKFADKVESVTGKIPESSKGKMPFEKAEIAAKNRRNDILKGKTVFSAKTSLIRFTEGYHDELDDFAAQQGKRVKNYSDAHEKWLRLQPGKSQRNRERKSFLRRQDTQDALVKPAYAGAGLVTGGVLGRLYMRKEQATATKHSPPPSGPGANLAQVVSSNESKIIAHDFRKAAKSALHAASAIDKSPLMLLSAKLDALLTT